MLARPWAVALIGPSSQAQLASNLRAMDLALTDGEIAALDALAEDPAAYWRHRSSLQWR